MTEQKAVVDFMELLAQTLANRIRDLLQDDLIKMINDNQSSIHADAVEGLEEFVNGCISESNRNLQIDAGDISNLEELVKDILKNAEISLDL